MNSNNPTVNLIDIESSNDLTESQRKDNNNEPQSENDSELEGNVAQKKERKRRPIFEYITSTKERNTAFNKRKQTLIKKAGELTQLTGGSVLLFVVNTKAQESRIKINAYSSGAFKVFYNDENKESLQEWFQKILHPEEDNNNKESKNDTVSEI